MTGLWMSPKHYENLKVALTQLPFPALQSHKERLEQFSIYYEASDMWIEWIFIPGGSFLYYVCKNFRKNNIWPHDTHTY